MNITRVKIYGVLDPGPMTGGEDFCSRKMGQKLFFPKIFRGEEIFSKKKSGDESI